MPKFQARCSTFAIHRRATRNAHEQQILGFPRPRENARACAAEYEVVSMFSGCGGMDLGFMGGFEVFGRAYDRLPFRIMWANELNEAACRTYRRNLKEDVHCGDVWAALDSMPKRADVLIGGFPCQDISVNGKRAGV